MKAVHHRFAVLDAWRGVAACVVALLHFTGWRASHLDGIAFVRYAWLMVDFFFCSEWICDQPRGARKNIRR
jgi:peptidoglycan/LPS O-acetylase OafA/YrhL